MNNQTETIGDSCEGEESKKQQTNNFSYDQVFNELTEFLHEKGYAVANTKGHRIKEVNHLGFGVLHPQKDLERKLFGVVPVKLPQPAKFLGIVFMLKGKLYAQCHGKEYQGELTGLVNDLSKKYGLKIEMYSAEDKPKIEQGPVRSLLFEDIRKVPEILDSYDGS